MDTDIDIDVDVDMDVDIRYRCRYGCMDHGLIKEYTLNHFQDPHSI